MSCENAQDQSADPEFYAPLGSQSGYPGHVGPPLQAVAEQFSNRRPTSCLLLCPTYGISGRGLQAVRWVDAFSSVVSANVATENWTCRALALLRCPRESDKGAI